MILFSTLCAATLLIWHTAAWSLHALQALTGLLCAGCLFRRQTTLAPVQWIALAALSATGAIGLSQTLLHTSAVPSDTLYAILHWTSLLAVFAAVSFSTAVHKDLDRHLTAFAVFAIATCLLALAQFYTSNGKLFWLWPTAEPRVLGPFLSRNNYASFALLALPVLLWKALRPQGLHWYWLTGASILYASAIASGSRAGALLATAELPAYFYLARRRLPPSAPWFFLLAAGAVMAAGWDLLSTKIHADNPLQYRAAIIQSAFRMAESKPQAGWGLGTFPSTYPAFATFDSGFLVNHAHNDWAEWAAEGGLPLLLVLTLFAIITVRAALRHPWALGLLAVYAHSLVDYPLQRFGLAAWVIVIAALVLVPSPLTNPQNNTKKIVSSAPPASSVTLRLSI